MQNVEIAVKECGELKGSVGWLSRILASESTHLSFGHTKDGEPAVWLEVPEHDINDCVALYGNIYVDYDYDYLGWHMLNGEFPNSFGGAVLTQAGVEVIVTISDAAIEILKAQMDEDENNMREAEFILISKHAGVS
ncbi:hypothetical protein ACFL34_02950 [Candidatus Sumerlaeota bacterium]